ncbi:hypothetical protein ACHWQZ_G011037 [Mnemiopsis leidyi]
MTEYLYKVIVIGNHNVGKTAFLDRYVNNNFSGNNYKRTLAVDYQLKVVQRKRCTLRMQFWDIAGQEHTKVLTRNYYNSASACIIVFDITNKKTYDDLKEWKAEVDNKLGQIPTLILANKHDLVDKYSTDPREQCVDDMELENLKSTLNVTEVFHVSAKTGYQVNHSMELLEQILMGVTIPRCGAPAETSQDDRQIKVDNVSAPSNSSKSCCG